MSVVSKVLIDVLFFSFSYTERKIEQIRRYFSVQKFLFSLFLCGRKRKVINIKNKWNALNEAYKQIEISQNSIGQSKENLRLHTDYYNAGTCTMSDLLEAQTMFQQSKDRFVENVTQYEIRKTEYLQSIGR
ncbi:MAG: TolC family protein [Bacteroidaceae bacterium]|nr:TolC family protein [Bacteroidaceae bacterium]